MMSRMFKKLTMRSNLLTNVSDMEALIRILVLENARTIPACHDMNALKFYLLMLLRSMFKCSLKY